MNIKKNTLREDKMDKNPKYLNNILLSINIFEVFIIPSEDAILLEIFKRKSSLQREIPF